MIYCEKDERWYQNDIHRKNEEALRLEVEGWKSECCSLEDALAQVERLKDSTLMIEKNNEERRKKLY